MKLYDETVLFIKVYKLFPLSLYIRNIWIPNKKCE